MAEYWVEFVASSEGILWQEIHLLKPIAWSTILYPYPHPKYNYWSVGFFVLVFEESRGKGKRITVREIDRWVVAKYLLIKEGVLQFQVLKKKKKKKHIHDDPLVCTPILVFNSEHSRSFLGSFLSSARILNLQIDFRKRLATDDTSFFFLFLCVCTSTIYTL